MVYGKIFTLFMTATLSGLFHANFGPALFAGIIGLGFATLPWYNIWWAILSHFNFVIPQGLHYAYHGRGTSGIGFKSVFSAIGSIVMIVVLATKWPAIKAYIQPINLSREFSSALASFWFWFSCYSIILMSIKFLCDSAFQRPISKISIIKGGPF